LAKNIKIIILAAGKGERLLPLTKDMPKSLVSIFGKPILEYQLNTIKKVGIDQIILITGYLKDKIKYKNIKYFTNNNYDSTNMVETLFCCKNEINDCIIVSYGDIIYEEKILRSLSEDSSDISVVVDKQWKKLWKLRSNNPINDTESLEIKNNKIISIGQKVNSIDEPDGQYIGLIKFQGKGIEHLLSTYENLRKKSLQNNGFYKNNKKFNQMYMTELLQEIIDLKYPIKPLLINGGWLEIDTIDDHKKYSELYFKNQLNDFIKIDEI
tara:strand:- start:3154 stop:3957 length:804 start_codon:yes stop_codon:yes gene_type:complete